MVPPDQPAHAVLCAFSAPSRSSAAAAAAVARASPSKDSKLLVRAAQRLIGNAQAETEQEDRALTVAAAAAPARQPAAPIAGKKPSAGVSSDRGSPLATVLAQYKEAQAAWAQEKVRASDCQADLHRAYIDELCMAMGPDMQSQRLFLLLRQCGSAVAGMQGKQPCP